ncbi:MAG: NHL repeat-containing protein, partial [Chitinophagaceae bacterium]
MHKPEFRPRDGSSNQGEGGISYFLFLLFAGIFLGFSRFAFCQSDSLMTAPIRTIAVKALHFTTDHLGNIYFITPQNRVVKYSVQNDTTVSYNNYQNGQLIQVDATDPLRVLLFYQDFGIITLLDRQFSVLGQIDLHHLQIFKPDAIATSNDNKIWVYDEQEAKLMKLDENGNLVLETGDLRQVIGQLSTTRILLDRGGFVYLCDPVNGIDVFDDFGTFKNQLPFFHVRSLQVFHHQLTFLQGGTLIFYNQETFSEKSIRLPDPKNLKAI